MSKRGISFADVADTAYRLYRDGTPLTFTLNVAINADILIDGAKTGKRATLTDGAPFMVCGLRGTDDRSTVTIRPVETDMANRTYEVSGKQLESASHTYKDGLIDLYNGITREDGVVTAEIMAKLKAEREEEDRVKALRELQLIEEASRAAAEEAAKAVINEELKIVAYGDQYGSW